MSIVIDTKNLTKQFGLQTAVDHVDLNVTRGQIFGLLGPNAAGKSTTIRLLTGLMSPDAGEIQILGMDLLTQTRGIKKQIGYVAQQFALYPELTVNENLAFYAGLYSGISKNETQDLLDKYDLSRFAKQRSSTLSGGFKRRLSIACAVAHKPELIFLDEPTAGIDPVTRKELWEQFYELAVSGKTLFITTHYMEEAERCHQLAFIHQGKLIKVGTPEQIKQSFQDYKVYACRMDYNPSLSKALKAHNNIYLLNQYGEELRIVTDKSISTNDIQTIINRQIKSDIDVYEVPASIEDVFMTLTRDK